MEEGKSVEVEENPYLSQINEVIVVQNDKADIDRTKSQLAEDINGEAEEDEE